MTGLGVLCQATSGGRGVPPFGRDSFCLPRISWSSRSPPRRVIVFVRFSGAASRGAKLRSTRQRPSCRLDQDLQGWPGRRTFSAARSVRMCSGVVPQQPPTM